MKTGLTTSVIMHVAVLGFGLVSLSAPRAYEVADVEALPVDIVPVESITQIQQGDKKAPMAETPAPIPTARPDPVENAQEIGENDIDLKTPPTPNPKPKPVEMAALPEPSPQPAPNRPVEPEPEPQKQPEAKPEPVPATEVTPQPQPKQDITPDPVAEAIEREAPAEENLALPQSAPVPQFKPQQSPKPQTAKAPERKDSEKPAVKQAAKPKSEEKKEFDADQIAALLNKEQPSGGGAKRSTQEAALGGTRDTGGAKLTQSEMDALRGQIQRCWNVPAGAADAQNLRVSIQVRLDPSGAIEGAPQIVSGGGSAGIERAAAESARRAILQCAPYNLPVEKYEAWADVIVNFDPSEMF